MAASILPRTKLRKLFFPSFSSYPVSCFTCPSFYKLTSLSTESFPTAHIRYYSVDAPVPEECISNILNSHQLKSILPNAGVSLLLKQLLLLAKESQPISSEKCQTSLLDLLLVQPLLEMANLSVSSVLDLFQLALAPDLASFMQSHVSLHSRLMLLNPNFVLEKLLNPMLRHGVVNPSNVVSKCPGLITAAVVHGEGDLSVLCVALQTLSGCLSRKDFALLTKSFPEVLTKSRVELLAKYNYFSETMGLADSSELLLASRHPHQFRHSTNIHIATCPAWVIPLSQTISRHTLLRLASQWPPSHASLQKRSRSYIFGELLTCSPKRFSFWLQYSADKLAKKAYDTSFSSFDVVAFEEICSNLRDESYTAKRDDCEISDNDETEIEYTKNILHNIS